jgi:hypothetical protein
MVIYQEDIHIPVNPPVLVGIVENQEVKGKTAKGLPGDSDPVGSHKNLNAGKTASHQLGFISGCFHSHQDIFTVRDDPVIGPGPFVASGKDSYVKVGMPGLQSPGNRDRQRGFSRPPHGQVPNRDDRDGEIVGFEKATVVQEISQVHSRSVSPSEGD